MSLDSIGVVSVLVRLITCEGELFIDQAADDVPSTLSCRATSRLVSLV